MSADNWAICPQCKVRFDAEQDNAQKRVSKAYGRVDPDKYMAMVKSLENPPHLESTLREDYGIGMDEEGEFTVSYRCSCQCGFSYTYSTKVEPEDTGALKHPALAPTTPKAASEQEKAL